MEAFNEPTPAQACVERIRALEAQEIFYRELIASIISINGGVVLLPDYVMAKHTGTGLRGMNINLRREGHYTEVTLTPRNTIEEMRLENHRTNLQNIARNAGFGFTDEEACDYMWGALGTSQHGERA